MKITNNVPKDWKDLQDKVCKLLNESGYLSESPKEIQTVRGKVEVDVFSTSETELIKQIICECKFWSSSIPKEKIHSFRTVVSDSGSMLGIFISKNGYQSGAHEAAYCTNVLLKDWDGFLDLIEKQWIKNQLGRIKKLAHPLSVYTDPLDVPLNKLDAEEIDKYKELNQKVVCSYIICRTLTENFYLQDYVQINDYLYTACDELFKYFEVFFTEVIKEYEDLFIDNPVDTWKLEAYEHMFIDLQLTN